MKVQSKSYMDSFISRNLDMVEEIDRYPSSQDFHPVGFSDINKIHNALIDCLNLPGKDTNADNIVKFQTNLLQYQQDRPDRSIFDEIGFITVSLLHDPIYTYGNRETAFFTGLHMLEENGYQVENYAQIFNSFDLKLCEQYSNYVYPEEAASHSILDNRFTYDGSSFCKRLEQNAVKKENTNELLEEALRGDCLS